MHTHTSLAHFMAMLPYHHLIIMMFAYAIIVCSSRRQEVGKKVEEWRMAMEDRALKISTPVERKLYTVPE